MSRIIFSLAIISLIVIVGIIHIHSTTLAQGSNSTGANNTLGSPVFIEHYNIISSKKTMVNGTEATEVVILGNGTINGVVLNHVTPYLRKNFF